MESVLKNNNFFINNAYTKVFEKEREHKKGGVFEIYSIKDVEEEEAKKALQKTLDKDHFFFIDAYRSNLKKDMLIKSIPNQKALKDENYLIREKNTLRFANQAEKKILDTELKKVEELSEQSGKSLEQSSYGRMAMANHRAVKRYDELRAMYGCSQLNPTTKNPEATVFISKVFKFESIPGQTVEFQGLESNAQITQKYAKFYDVTLIDLNLSLKKVFEILQVYCSSHENDNNKKLNPENLCPPLKVTLKIGSKNSSFVLSNYIPSPSIQECQMMVSMQIPNTTRYKGNSYGYLLGGISQKTKQKYGIISKSQEEQSQIAQDILDCLNNPMNGDVNAKGEGLRKWKVLGDSERHKLLELIVLTQVVESNIMPKHQSSSRTPGMNKLARKLFSSIANGTATFETAFMVSTKGAINEDYGYPPIGTGGTERARSAINNVTRKGAGCYDMSEDSGD